MQNLQNLGCSDVLDSTVIAIFAYSFIILIQMAATSILIKYKSEHKKFINHGRTIHVH